MEHAAGTNDLIGAIPAPALHLQRGVVVGANRAAQILLGPTEQILGQLAPADRTMLRARADAAA
ncbi:MAG: hypothetical protein ACTHN0_08195, partial [Aquihabitans sp.]